MYVLLVTSGDSRAVHGPYTTTDEADVAAAALKAIFAPLLDIEVELLAIEKPIQGPLPQKGAETYILPCVYPWPYPQLPMPVYVHPGIPYRVTWSSFTDAHANISLLGAAL